MQTITVQGSRLEYVRLPSAHPRPGAPAMVFLHEGLGSISMWRDFPQRVADATGCEAVVYSRRGYGRSAVLKEPRAPRYMHDEALAALPELLDRLNLERPILFGHSDGASIALLHAARFAREVRGAIVLAPHIMVEQLSVDSIAKSRDAYLDTDLRARLARYHDDPDSAFWGWNRIWLDAAFRDWSIEDEIGSIRCPLLAVQGLDDAYGTLAQIRGIAQRVPRTRLLELPACGHSAHRDQPDAVLAASCAFLAEVAGVDRAPA